MSQNLGPDEIKNLEFALRTAEERRGAWSPPERRQDPFASCLNRRAFLRGGAALVGGLTVSAHLGGLLTKPAFGQSGSAPSPYGTPVPIPDSATNYPMLKLPTGFRYKSWGWTGDPMIDGRATPGAHDGMGVVNLLNNRFVQITRNHEQDTGAPFTFNPYGPNSAGGNTTFLFDLQTEQFMRPYGVLSGTIRNCAGGVTPWGTWLSCEETTTTRNGVPHGYVFEVGSWPSTPIALKPMGRFSHEAVAIDPATGFVYETEDNGDNSGFYRFIPNQPGALHMGGQLKMMKIAGQPQKSTIPLINDGQVFGVEWVDVANPDSLSPSCFTQGFTNGGARFRRLEGIWYGGGKLYFLTTEGGPANDGQVFEYDPAHETFRVIYASTGSSVLENPDNLVVAPDGTILMCEDNGRAGGERLQFLNSTGVFTFAVNNINFSNTTGGFGSYVRPESGRVFNSNFISSEWAGATFSPDGKWLFVNIQSPGITFAITGPWTWLR